jgi:pyoverdine/dityrosine biosynthesis protein Dit1
MFSINDAGTAERWPSAIPSTIPGDIDESIKEAARAILRVIFRDRRLLPDKNALQSGEIAEEEFAIHYPTLFHSIVESKPIHMILPAFPAKSSNRSKTLGDLPDFGEVLGLTRLQALCDEIRSVHAPGARCTICSDGRVFSDLVGVTDEAVTRYREELKVIIRQSGTSDIEVFDLDDVFPVNDYGLMREELLVCYAEPLSVLQQRTREKESDRDLFNGIHRFVFEDMLFHASSERSRNEIRNLSKAVAYRVIQRSNAWSKLIAQRFPDSLRLSIHPQPRVTQKIGIYLVPTSNPWGTPWHTVVLEDRDGYRLVKRADAEEQDAVLVYRNGRPSHFAMREILWQEKAA